ncbi:MAG: response regulator [Candidatus Latescibacteria bacterium]|nr:response regulator [Candidatus Latescibacterota bacterium]
MAEVQILVVEDEGIVAKDIQNTLEKLGYAVPAVAYSGGEAVKKAAETHPDLVLMDIVLRGDMDGVEAAEQIRSRTNIPVVYLTAYADEKTLQRAKITEPYGYILKPFEERELHVAIEVALYKHKMEEKLKQSEQWLATTLNSIGDAVIATDRVGRVSLMNPVAEALTGWKQEDAAGKPLQDVFNIISEKTGAQAENPVTRVMREGVVIGLANHTILTDRDGTKRPVDDSGAPIKDDQGNIIGVVLVFRDITKRRQAEKKLRKTLKELQEAKDMLVQSEKLAAVGRLAAGVAHEILNPVNIMSLKLQLLERIEGLSTPMRNSLSTCKEQLERVVRITKDLSQFSRVSKEKYVILADLNKVIEHVLTLCAPQFKVEDIKTDIQCYPNLPTIAFDKDRIEQVMFNIVSNAIGAMKAQENKILRVATKPEPSEENVNYLRVIISDTGPGIREEDMYKIFDPFFTTKESGEGTGLGLFICHRIIEDHGGKIWVENNESGGASFFIELPAGEEVNT